MAELFGFLNIDKPLGMTSHDVVAHIRRKFRIKRVGHAGTLDPLATGVLVICIGEATRLSDLIMHTQKTYHAAIRFGETTETYDAEGAVINRVDVSHLTLAHIEAVLPQFIGDIDQVPPMYSAIKKDGKKLYELARAGKAIALEPRRVTVHQLRLVQFSAPVAEIEVVCGSGTYIRCLAHDIGQVLGVGAHLIRLIRTRSGVFKIEDAHHLDDIIHHPNPESYIVDERIALAHLPAVSLHQIDAEHVLHGRRPQDTPPPTADLGRAYAPDGSFIALLRAEHDQWQPFKVFRSTSS